MSVLGRGSLASSWIARSRRPGIDADMQQWFHDFPLAPQPNASPMVDDRLRRMFDEMVAHLGFDADSSQR